MLSDHLGSVRNITNSGNTVRWQYRYDTYGGFENGTKLLTIDNATFNDPDSGFTPRTINGGVLTTNSMTTPRRFRYLFTGQSWDPHAGLYYYKARWYDQRTGRFLSEDPIGFVVGDTNLYVYCANEPMNLLDPSGTEESPAQKPLTNEEKAACCKKSLSTLPDSAQQTTRGWNTCCHSQKISCVNDALVPSPPPADPHFSTTAADFLKTTLRDCARAHEDSHHDQTEDCNEDNEQKCLKFKDKTKQNKQECNAHQLEIDCLRKSLSTMPKDMQLDQRLGYIQLINQKTREYADFANGQYKCVPPVKDGKPQPPPKQPR